MLVKKHERVKANTLTFRRVSLRMRAASCNTLQHTATRCVVDASCTCALSERESGAEVGRSFTCVGGAGGVNDLA